MKKRTFSGLMLSITAGILIAVVLSSFMPVSGEERLYRDVIRLHVIAESDSEEDQATKLRVRDRILDTVSDRLESAENFGDAYDILSLMIPEITAAATEVSGTDARVIFEREEYPVRYYEGYTLPAGEYMSMRVVLGEGEGKNWWCVLFPPLCTDAAADDSSEEEEFLAAGFTPEEYRIIRNESGTKYKVRFRILEILSETFGFDY